MISISYVVTVYNELQEIKKLIPFLIEHKKPQDEICVLWDNKGPQEVLDYLKSIENQIAVLHTDKFENNFADWKNKACSLATKTWICNLDSDEIPHVNLIDHLHYIIEFNPSIEAYWIPRVNTLDGNKIDVIQYIKEQSWVIDNKGRINWPYDAQLRLFKRDPNIIWNGVVHERITGYKTVSRLPDEEEYAIYHPKTLARQINQNLLYQKIGREKIQKQFK